MEDDYNWSVEQQDKTLKKLVKKYGVTPEKAQQYKDWFMMMSDEDIERLEDGIHLGYLQWKFEEDNNWNIIDW